MNVALSCLDFRAKRCASVPAAHTWFPMPFPCRMKSCKISVPAPFLVEKCIAYRGYRAASSRTNSASVRRQGSRLLASTGEARQVLIAYPPAERDSYIDPGYALQQ